MSEEEKDTVDVTHKVSKVERLDEAVFVIGHPRSGTSVSCQLLASSDDVTWMNKTGSNDDNPYGYYEYKPFLQESVRFIQETFDVSRLNKIQELLNNFEELSNPPGLKMLHAHSWYNWKDFFHETKNLIIFRHPSRCRKSNWKHKLNWPIDWHSTNNAIISVFEDADNAVLISLECLMKHTEAVADLIEEDLGLEVDPNVVDVDEYNVKETNVVAGDLEMIVYERLKEIEENQF